MTQALYAHMNNKRKKKKKKVTAFISNPERCRAVKPQEIQAST
jgi:hypothetical protein